MSPLIGAVTEYVCRLSSLSTVASTWPARTLSPVRTVTLRTGPGEAGTDLSHPLGVGSNAPIQQQLIGYGARTCLRSSEPSCSGNGWIHFHAPLR